MRLTIYLPRDAEEALDRLVRVRGGTRSQLLADLVRQASHGGDAIQRIDERLERIETLLRDGARSVATGAPAETSGEPGQADADRSMAALRAWAMPTEDE